MRAINVTPGKAGAVALEDIAEPVGQGEVLARTLAIGICGTDREIIAGKYRAVATGDRGMDGLLPTVDGLVMRERGAGAAAQ